MASILIVDDNRHIRALLKDVLEMEGHDIQEAENGDEALQILQVTTLPVTLIIIDILMPGRSGHEVIRTIRQERGSPKIIAISGGSLTNHDDNLELALENGATQTLKKPFEIQAFRNTVAQVLLGTT